ncbi:hypothetical protein [Streptomyces sp. NPDC088350]|uniref:hypothetical protein n=1 Tax=Streptomyces sp. NPDC088350 TaxID=3365854 RepID=UPI0037FFB5A6
MDRDLTLQDLQAVDPRSLHSTPGGALTPASPDVAVAHHQRLASVLVLAPEVGDLTRRQFDRLRTVFVYGVLNYELFTMVADDARLAFEQALRDRFMAFHKGTVAVRDKHGHEHRISATGYSHFFRQMRDLKLTGPRIQMAGRWTGFNGTLDGLISWARREGLLRGGRSRRVETFLQDMRNEVAHGSFHLLGPGDALMALSTLVEVINQLWGCPTPGGRLYPQPITREVLFIGWTSAGDECVAGLAENLATSATTRDTGWTYVLVRAVHWSEGREDPNLLEFDSLHATTSYPTTLLWGPGTRSEALVWLRENDPQPDICDYMDQVFLVRVHDGHVLLPTEPGVAAGFSGPDRLGNWYAIRADGGLDAFNHVRSLESGVAGHASSGECRQCPVSTLIRGDLDMALRAAAGSGADTTPRTPPDVRTPPLRYPRIIPLPAAAAGTP